MAHLLARYLDILPLFFPMALPMKEVLNNSPYLGVFVFCLSALNNAFSAPRIWIVEAGYLASVLSDPEWAISLAATFYPIKVVKLGDTISILFFKYSCIYLRNSIILNVLSHSSLSDWMSRSLIYCPIEFKQLSTTFSAISPSSHIY